MMTRDEQGEVHAAAAALHALGTGHLNSKEGMRAQEAACALIADVCAQARARMKDSGGAKPGNQAVGV